MIYEQCAPLVPLERSRAIYGLIICIIESPSSKRTRVAHHMFINKGRFNFCLIAYECIILLFGVSNVLYHHYRYCNPIRRDGLRAYAPYISMQNHWRDRRIYSRLFASH